MVEIDPSVEPAKKAARWHSLSRTKLAFEPHAWLVPGDSAWEVWEPSSTGKPERARVLSAEETGPVPGVAVVALPETLVTCQLFWLVVTDEKNVPDLVRMQCERRQLLRQDEVWTHRILRRESERMLVQVLILQNVIPPVIKVEGPARFEAQAHCLDLPPRAACVWLSLGSVSLALTDEAGVVCFQSLPHRALTRECLADVQSTLMLAQAQGWVAAIDTVVLIGDWDLTATPSLGTMPGVRVERVAQKEWVFPKTAVDLVPQSVRHLRRRRHRQHRMRLGALALAAVYALFLAAQMISVLWTSSANAGLQSKLDAVMPSVIEMQTTARQLDALNPALDVKTYPLEVLYRAMAVLPEKGVRLTRFEIIGNPRSSGDAMPKTLWSDAQAALVAALVQARKEAGLSQAALAGKLHCQQSLIARIESGERRIDVVELVILARAIGVDPAGVVHHLIEAVPADAGL